MHLMLNVAILNNFLQKPLSGSRLTVVKKAFEKADKTGDGVITTDDLKK